jgi:RND family efflux transporter MFP subunit
MKTGNLLLIAFFASLMILSGCSNSDKSDDDSKQAKSEQKDLTDEEIAAKKKQDEKPPIPVEVVKLTRGDIQKTYPTITSLEAENNVSVVARSSGILESILVEEGDHVKKGQVLAQLDVEQLSLEAKQFKATLNKLEGELTRQRSLFKKRLGSNDALEKAKYEFEAQTAQYQLSKLKLQYATVTAPISGIISERLVKQGNLISNNDILFKIVDPTSLKAVLFLPEKELSNISKGQPVLLSVAAYPNKIMQGTVERIRPIIDSDTGTFRVVAGINNNDELLQAGMFGRVELIFDVHRDTLLLGRETVITQDNRSHVFIIKNDIAIQTPIKIGFSEKGLVEVLGGLEDNDMVVSTGHQILKHEAKVEIVGEYAKPKDETTTDNDKHSKSLAQNP